MPKLKDIPKIDRPRERFLEKGPDALSKGELLAILLGSGIKGKNVKQLSEQIIRKFGDRFLEITADDLLEIPGIGEAKALQIVSALALVKRFYEELGPKNNIVLSAQDAISVASEIRDKKKEHLVCLYLNARNALLKKEIISIGILDKSIIHPREIFGPASDAYHLLENLASWEKPTVHGKAKKMDRSHIKSNYCLNSAPKAFADLSFNYN